MREIARVCCVSIGLVSWLSATVEEGGHNVRLLTLQPVATKPKGLQKEYFAVAEAPELQKGEERRKTICLFAVLPVSS